jgi:hypothetical protein
VGKASVNFGICGDLTGGGICAWVLVLLSIVGTSNPAPAPALAINNCLLVSIATSLVDVYVKKLAHLVLALIYGVAERVSKV